MPQIEDTLTIDVAPERVYTAIAGPAQVTTSMATIATGDPATRGGLHIDFEFDDATRDHVTRGTYKTV